MPTRIFRAAALGLTAATLTGGPLWGSAAHAARRSPPPGSVPVAVIDGKGWGHGVGMAQDGAYWMGVSGSSTAQILDHFYPGTRLGHAGGTVRVEVSSGPGAVVVQFPQGGEVRDSPSGPVSTGFPVAVAPGGSVQLSFDGGRYHARALSGTVSVKAVSVTPVEAATSPTTAPPLLRLPLPTLPAPPTLPPIAPPPATPAPAPAPAPAPPEPVSGRSLWAVPRGGGTTALPARGRRYRGLIEAVAGGGGLRLVNQVDVEQYLRGMGEVLDPGWPAASLRAQAIAARTYALRRAGDLCDTQQCQVYLGQQAEYGAMDAAVAATKGQVVMYGGGMALTAYSANGGGMSASAAEGFGGTDEPYLRAAPYDTRDPNPWTVRVSLAELAGRFGFRGEPASARVSRAGPSGRALEVTIEGKGQPVTVEGRRFAADLGLRSNLFTVRVESQAPPPPLVPGTPAALSGQADALLAEPVQAGIPPGRALPATSTSSTRPRWIALAVLLLTTWVQAAARKVGPLRP